MKKYMLNGVIADFEYHSDFFDVCSPKGLKKFLATLEKGEKAEIEINSPGGYVVYGVEMANAIKNSEAHIIAHVTGMAASMASVIACACDEIVMEEASFMMIHDPWGYTEGNAEEMRKHAAILDQMKEVCMAFYLGKFDRTREELADLMSSETWMTGPECQANGLKCTVQASNLKAAASVRRNHFGHLPEAAKAYLRVVELTDAERDLVAQARAAQTAPETAPTSAGTTSAAGVVPTPAAAPAPEVVPTPTAPSASEVAASAATPSTPAPSAAVDWEARFKGASKKINELQASLAAAAEAATTLQRQLDERQVALDQSAAQLAARDATIEQLKAAAVNDAESLKAKDADLAQARNSLAEAKSEIARLEQNRHLLTGGVLVQAETLAAKLAKGKSPEEREAIRQAHHAQ